MDRLILTRVPVLLGGGIPLFGPLPGEVRLEHVAARCFPDGLVQSEYRRPGGAVTRSRPPAGNAAGSPFARYCASCVGTQI